MGVEAGDHFSLEHTGVFLGKEGLNERIVGKNCHPEKGEKGLGVIFKVEVVSVVLNHIFKEKILLAITVMAQVVEFPVGFFRLGIEGFFKGRGEGFSFEEFLVNGGSI